jgi:hypothetical protein
MPEAGAMIRLALKFLISFGLLVSGASFLGESFNPFCAGSFLAGLFLLLLGGCAMLAFRRSLIESGKEPSLPKIGPRTRTALDILLAALLTAAGVMGLSELLHGFDFWALILGMYLLHAGCLTGCRAVRKLRGAAGS